MTPGGGGSDLVVALGLVLALEGALYALAPGFMKGMLERARDLDEASFRKGGGGALALGVALVWWVRR